MKKALFFFCGILIFSSCLTDQQIQDSFAGEYEVSIEAPDSEKELKKAKKDLKKEMKQAKKDIDKDIKKAQQEIEEEFGEDSNFGKAISSFVEGAGHLANSMTDLGESLGEMGIDLGNNILKNVNFRANFKNNGEIVFGRKGRINFQTNELHWKIKNGKMLLWNSDEEDETEADIFEIINISDNEVDLVGEEVTFHLIRQAE